MPLIQTGPSKILKCGGNTYVKPPKESFWKIRSILNIFLRLGFPIRCTDWYWWIVTKNFSETLLFGVIVGQLLLETRQQRPLAFKNTVPICSMLQEILQRQN